MEVVECKGLVMEEYRVVAVDVLLSNVEEPPLQMIL
jgi:hypothetical protein